MPIPAFTPEGFLPEGIHDCLLAEIEERFGSFQRTDARCRLFARLKPFVRDARATGFFASILLDGSFVTAKDVPNDIDLILILKAGHDFDAETRPFEYNVLSRKRINRIHGFDALTAEEGSIELARHIRLFSRVRRSELRKGLLRILL